MGYGSYYVTSPRICFSPEDYREWKNDLYHESDDDYDNKIISKWFLPYCDEWEKFTEFVEIYIFQSSIT